MRKILTLPAAALLVVFSLSISWLAAYPQAVSFMPLFGSTVAQGSLTADAGSLGTLSVLGATTLNGADAGSVVVASLSQSNGSLVNFAPSLYGLDGGAPTALVRETVNSMSLSAATNICTTYLSSGASVFTAMPFCSVTIADGTPTISTAPSVDAGVAGGCIFEAASTTGHFTVDCKGN